MQNVYFFTGFPGFISNQLIKEVLTFNKLEGEIYVLVHPSMVEIAKRERESILKSVSIKPEQFHLIEGDITSSTLGIVSNINSDLIKRVTHVFHLAAIYDLAVPKELAFKVNVEGTRNVNEWVKKLRNLKRYVYFSTGYVAGTREGKLYEHELIRPPSFKNYYEETKFEAEVLVEELKRDIPITIIRPGIVKGHSRTGETIKFDGPYFILNFLDKLRFLPLLPNLGKSQTVVNLVPVDYIIEATTYLSFLDGGEGKTYHLTDPRPYKVSEIYEMFMKELLQKRPVGTLPLALAKGALSSETMRKYLKVEKEALDYFTWKGYFDCSQAIKDLENSGIRCPDFREGVPAMVAFYVKNKDNPKYQIKIS